MNNKYRVKTWKVINLLKETINKQDLPLVTLAIEVIDNSQIEPNVRIYAINEIKKLYPDLARYMEFYNNEIFEFNTSIEAFKKLNINIF